MTDYILLKAAQRYLERMQPDDQIRIINALDTLISNPTVLDIKSLKGRPELRLRVGKYRVLFREDTENQLYVVTAIGSRGDVYK
ncbi:plasmid stabilization protein [[Phormidium ambiguum] IAM M-71]|uniref:Plasmid stabilization protein n=1 Tax=[Phormidium ambiguum] IAM M-71 TaxID=454136 RepID=A0A1U7IQ08_9CYAN|nr:type II toxin-antitoxin system RelE/ParE family toxin [Phormidium ambiguum]OKH39391.1 plasmid stabilization protein [Phormidium ambiguum IAM M-71]